MVKSNTAKISQPNLAKKSRKKHLGESQVHRFPLIGSFKYGRLTLPDLIAAKVIPTSLDSFKKRKPAGFLQKWNSDSKTLECLTYWNHVNHQTLASLTHCPVGLNDVALLRYQSHSTSRAIDGCIRKFRRLVVLVSDDFFPRWPKYI